MTDPNTPTGIVMICTDKEGREIATATDFQQAGYGGFSLQRAQEIRCRTALVRHIIDRHASPIIGQCMTHWHQDELVKKMVDEHGYRITTICLPDDLRDAEALSDD